MIKHTLKIIEDENSKILILGTFPSEVSRRKGYYYANSRNGFWEFLQTALKDNRKIESFSEARSFCIKHHIALYDVIESCSPKINKKGKYSSSDTDLKNIVPATKQISNFIKNHRQLKYIIVISTTASVVFNRLIWPYVAKSHVIVLSYVPSTSPANRGKSKYSKSNEQLNNKFKEYLLDASN